MAIKVREQFDARNTNSLQQCMSLVMINVEQPVHSWLLDALGFSKLDRGRFSCVAEALIVGTRNLEMVSPHPTSPFCITLEI